MDLNAGRSAEGEAGTEVPGREFFHLMPDVAGGRKTRAGHWKIRNAPVLFKPAPVTRTRPCARARRCQARASGIRPAPRRGAVAGPDQLR